MHAMNYKFFIASWYCIFLSCADDQLTDKQIIEKLLNDMPSSNILVIPRTLVANPLHHIPLKYLEDAKVIISDPAWHYKIIMYADNIMAFFATQNIIKKLDPIEELDEKDAFTRIFSHDYFGCLPLFKIYLVNNDDKILAASRIIIPEYERNKAQIDWLYVCKKYRNKGLGRQLVNMIKECSSALRKEQVIVYPGIITCPGAKETKKSYEECAAWYEKKGFIADPNYYRKRKLSISTNNTYTVSNSEIVTIQFNHE
jgi:GNAT superfamily N-acetyltransferase